MFNTDLTVFFVDLTRHIKFMTRQFGEFVRIRIEKIQSLYTYYNITSQLHYI